MAEEPFGTEQLTDEDRAYNGSRFRDVVAAVFANPYQRVWGAAGEPPLPVHPVTLASVTKGALSLGGRYLFQDATARAVDSRSDLRWGPDRQGFRRILHPNGVCLTGRWEIMAGTPYSGNFAVGSRALVVGRYSTCCAETRRGHTRSLALVGKLYPTSDPDHAMPLLTASFITQEDIGGADTAYINDAELRNAPDTTASRRGGGLPILLITFDRGDPAPKRTLTFTIEVTDEGETTGSALKQRRTFRNWRAIGTLVFDNPVVSANGDRVLHFNHPTWRDDRNDPKTTTRVNEHKVRPGGPSR